MALYRFIATVPTLILAAFVVVAESTGNSQSKDLAPTSRPESVTLKAKSEVVKANSPMLITITIKNTSDKPIMTVEPLGIFNTCPWSTIEVRDSLGNEAPSKYPELTAPPKAEDINKICVGNNTFLGLLPGESKSGDMDISTFYDLSRTGKYNLQAIFFGGDAKPWVKSNIISLTVTQ